MTHRDCQAECKMERQSISYALPYKILVYYKIRRLPNYLEIFPFMIKDEIRGNWLLQESVFMLETDLSGGI